MHYTFIYINHNYAGKLKSFPELSLAANTATLPITFISTYLKLCSSDKTGVEVDGAFRGAPAEVLAATLIERCRRAQLTVEHAPCSFTSCCCFRETCTACRQHARNSIWNSPDWDPASIETNRSADSSFRF